MICRAACLIAAVISLAPASRGQAPDAAALVKEGQKLRGEGDIDGAVEKLQAAVTADPQRFEAQEALGQALDLAGRYSEAREHLERAIALAPDDEKNSAFTAMGISFAFESRAEDAARYYRRAFDAQMDAKEPADAAATANALGRIYLESGNLQKAEEWYRTGYETSRRLSNQPAEQITLWEMRWHNALGRIAARRGRRAAALQHAASVKRLLDKGGNEGQRVFYPYLLGYIHFHTRHYREAVAALTKGNQEDAFVLGLIAQSYQRLHDAAHAREYFERVLARTDHNINAAFARPLARAYLKRAPR